MWAVLNSYKSYKEPYDSKHSSSTHARSKKMRFQMCLISILILLPIILGPVNFLLAISTAISVKAVQTSVVYLKIHVFFVLWQNLLCVYGKKAWNKLMCFVKLFILFFSGFLAEVAKMFCQNTKYDFIFSPLQYEKYFIFWKFCESILYF